MTGPAVRHVKINGQDCRIWERGEGEPIHWLASSPMLLKWTAIHENISERARLLVCSLPGFPGSRGHDLIDDHLGWCLAARDLLIASGFQPGGTLVGSSTAGALAADIAALWPDFIGTLTLIAPHGIYEEGEPFADMFALPPKQAPSLLSSEPQRYASHIAPPEGTEPVLWQIEVARGNEAAARFLWPFGDTKVKTRLNRVKARTLVLWGTEDRIISAGYANRFVEAIGANATAMLVPGGGHLVELDRPQEVTDAILSFVGDCVAPGEV